MTPEQYKAAGNDEFKRGNYHKAVEYYSEAIKMEPSWTALHCNRSNANFKLGNFRDSLRSVQIRV